ncbi:uncharacterized protein LOC136086637 [Hydra vulgaris]|uniref:Uncharacterized protein LOC136086637 n=1 Tax=Hydra vulgaris TaxID=6087 RepID=A0ABM4CSN4_HYDVU
MIIDHDFRRKHTRIQNCKKFDCPAQLTITEYLEFKEYKLIVDTVRNRKAKSKDLRYAISSLSKKKIKQIRKFCIAVPDILAHNGHMIIKDAGITQRIDPELVSVIDMDVKEGVLSTIEIKRLIKIQVKNNFNKAGHVLPESSNKRFYPRNSSIQNHITISRRKLCQSLIDQECLQSKIKEWRESNPTISIFFRPKGLIYISMRGMIELAVSDKF